MRGQGSIGPSELIKIAQDFLENLSTYQEGYPDHNIIPEMQQALEGMKASAHVLKVACSI